MELLKTSLEQRQANDTLLDNDGDRHFLLSLLPDFRRVPIDKKMDVKLAMIQSIKSAILPTQSTLNNYNHIQYLSTYPSAPNLPSTHFPIYPSPSLPPHVSSQLSTTHSHFPTNTSTDNSFINLQSSTSQRTETVIPILSPQSIESRDTSTDGSIDLLVDYQNQTQNFGALR